ncbi:SIR2 family protein [Leptospira sp. 201903074]|uniref:SIR2 family protein n=1 Tax=Leptospira abararensis TaxID=2810036 RepID=UPI00196369D6|nr:SIR2 family protein [Leptospira abararensis]MBM9547454.1 SIR2 family protein [Leptospira abararensis]
MTEFNILQPNHLSLANRIKNGDIILFTGAGFSLGATNYQGNSIPSVTEFKKHLIKDVLAIQDETSSQFSELFSLDLSSLSDYCEEENRTRYLACVTNHFDTKFAADFHLKLLNLPWKKIYTLNVDNLIEVSLRKNRKQFTVIDDTESKFIARDNIELIKLHGNVQNQTSRLIFSKLSYKKSSAGLIKDYRINSLMEDFKRDNILIIGASLTDELDIDLELLKHGNFLMSKIYYLAPTISELQRKMLIKKYNNIEFITETSETFCKKLNAYYENFNEKLAKSSIQLDSVLNNKNFILIDETIKKENYLNPNLYIGGHPRWVDVFTDHDVITKLIKTNLTEIEENIESFQCYIISGKSLSGKSLFLKQIGKYFHKNYYVIDYRGTDILTDLEILIKKYNQTNKDKKIIILIDNAAWVLNILKNLIKSKNQENIKIIFCVRSSILHRKSYLFDNIQDFKKSVKIIEISGKFDLDDSTQFIKKLKEKSYLGKYANISLEEAAKHFLNTYNRHDILICLYEFSQGEKFKERIDKFLTWVAKCESRTLYKIILLLYILEEFGDLSLKTNFFATMISNSIDFTSYEAELHEITNFSLMQGNDFDDNLSEIKSRSPELLNSIVNKISHETRQELIIELLKDIATNYYNNLKNSKTYEAQVFYHLIRSQNLRVIFRKKNSSEIDWKSLFTIYKETHKYFEDIHLYWLHRAISEIKHNLFKDAEIHLDQAKKLRGNQSFEIEHTEAILFLERSINEEGISKTTRNEYFKKAEHILLNQIKKIDIHNDAYAIHSYVIKSCTYFTKHKTEISNSSCKEMIQLYKKSKNAYGFQSVLVRNMLKTIHHFLNTKNLSNLLTLDQEEFKILNNKSNNEEIIESIDLL